MASDAADAAGQAAGGAAAALEGGLGHAPMIGAMSVPPSWTAPAPLAGPLASSLGGTPMVAPPAMAAGMPIGATGARAYGRAVPQYGFRPSFVARPPAAG